MIWFDLWTVTNQTIARSENKLEAKLVLCTLDNPNRPPQGIFVEKVRGHGSTANNQVD